MVMLGAVMSFTNSGPSTSSVKTGFGPGSVMPEMPDLWATWTEGPWAWAKNSMLSKKEKSFTPIVTEITDDSYGVVDNVGDKLKNLKSGRPAAPFAASDPAWKLYYLGLIDVAGAPTQRGIVFSFFHHGEGLAVAAALEDESYPIEELVFDLANLRAGPRFAGDDSPYGGRLGALCQRIYERADLPGYLDMGVPLDYGAGASEVVRDIVERGASRSRLLTDSLRQGDLERAFIEWRSLLRHIMWAPDYALPRWRALKSAATDLLDKSVSPTAAVRT